MADLESIILGHRPTILIVGPGKSGKDLVADWLAANTRLTRGPGTSGIIAPYIADEDGITFTEAMAKRREERDRWVAKGDELIELHNDPAFLVRECLKVGRIVVGCRRREEVRQVRLERLVDLVLWIERPGCDDSTMGFGPEMADTIIENNRTIEKLYERLEGLARFAGLLRSN